MQEITTNWLLLLAVLILGIVVGRLTAKSPIQRDRERKSYEAGLRHMKARMTSETVAVVEDLLRGGKKIEAIKRVRQDLEIGLKEAKDLVEAWPSERR